MDSNIKKIKMEVEFEYDAYFMHGNDADSIDWFYNDILCDSNGLTVFSDEIGDDIGIIRVLKVEKC